MAFDGDMVFQNSSSGPAFERLVSCKDHPKDPKCGDGFYLYRLNESANMAFCILYCFQLILLVGIAVLQRRAHIYSATLFCGLLTNILGYTGRIASANNQIGREMFYMQVTCLTIGPAFLAATIYWAFQSVVRYFDHDLNYTPIAPRYYLSFLLCDFVSLILQACGGGMAAAAHRKGTDMSTGTNIMIAGLAFQTFTMFFFSLLALRFAVRVFTNRPRQRDNQPQNQAQNQGNAEMSLEMKGFLLTLAISTLLILGRSCYRIAELSGGWRGARMANQTHFIIFEGIFVLAASGLLLGFHPAMAAMAILDSGRTAKVGTPAEPVSGASRSRFTDPEK